MHQIYNKKAVSVLYTKLSKTSELHLYHKMYAKLRNLVISKLQGFIKVYIICLQFNNSRNF